jgi:hypothetical protein
MASISQIQNEEISIRRLAAQRQMYSEAKKFRSYHLIIAVPITVSIFILAVIFPSVQKFANGWGIVLFLLELGILRNLEKTLHDRAAMIQELFDCEVLGIPWNDVKCRAKPDPEDVIIYSDKHFKNAANKKKLENWYSIEVDKLPFNLGRIVCQRSNITWEGRLRRRYSNTITILMVLLFLSIVIIGGEKDYNLVTIFVNLIIPLLPAFGWGIPEIMQNLNAAKNLDSLKELIERTWKDAFSYNLSDQQLIDIARQIQDEIYDCRRLSPLIPDRIYEKFRPKDENLMWQASAELANEALELLKK